MFLYHIVLTVISLICLQFHPCVSLAVDVKTCSNFLLKYYRERESLSNILLIILMKGRVKNECGNV